MKPIEFTEDIVSVLKGAPLSVLVLLMISKQPLSAQYIERRTRYSDKLVHSALLLLEEKFLITRNGRYSWRIAIDARQLPLIIPSDETEAEQADLDGQVEVIPESCEDVNELLEAPAHSHENQCDLAGYAKNATTRNYSESELFRVPSSSSLNLKTSDLTDLPLLDQAESEKIRVAENLAACDRFGIGEPKRSAISRLPGVTSRMIAFHCSDVVRSGLRIGAAIKRLERGGWKVPDDWIEPVDNSECFSPRNVCAQTFYKPLITPPEFLERWEKFLESIRSSFKKVDFETWLQSAVLSAVDGDGWTIRVGNSHAAGWIEEHALGALESAAGVKIKVEW